MNTIFGWLGDTSPGKKRSLSEVLPSGLATFPKLLAAGQDDTLNTHHSFEIVQALSLHATKMNQIEDELALLKTDDKTYKGHSSEKLALALQNYATKNPGRLPSSSSAGNAFGTKAAVTVAGTGSMTMFANEITKTDADFSWAYLLKSLQWARVLYAILWIVSGLILVFFGYASLFWLSNLRVSKRDKRARNSQSRSNIQALFSRSRRYDSTSSRKVLSGGIGGIIIGFLFFSYLASIIHNALCVDSGKKPLSAAAFFVVWLAPGLLGAVFGGSIAIVTRLMIGILGANSTVLILTAVFGIRTFLIRIILLAILAPLLTTACAIDRMKLIMTLCLNACTSLIGMVTFLNGVALFSPSVNASSSWIDLWEYLFMRDGSHSQEFVTKGWASGAFKGYIAGAVIGSFVGFLFEFYFHKRSGEDPEAEWNQYLGSYTNRMENGAKTDPDQRGSQYPPGNTADMTSRAGLFEPAPSAWQRMVEFFDSESSRPAHYGNLSGDGTSLLGRSLSIDGVGDRLRRKKTARSNRSGAARFEALSKRDDDSDSGDDDDDESKPDEDGTALGSDFEETKGGMESKYCSNLPTLRKYDTPLENNSLSVLPRPPLLTSSSSGSSRSSDIKEDSNPQSRLTGTTARDSNFSSKEQILLHTPVDHSSDNNTETSRESHTVPVTPSLINAISRIQQAHHQAQAWREQHDAKNPKYPS